MGVVNGRASRRVQAVEHGTNTEVTMTFSLLPLLLGLTLGSPAADAGVHFAVHAPGFAVVVDPWSPWYMPPHRYTSGGGNP